MTPDDKVQPPCCQQLYQPVPEHPANNQLFLIFHYEDIASID